MNSFNCWIILLVSAFLVLLISTTASSQEATSLREDDLTNIKRAWKDVGASWGKRGWKDMQGTWGKRGWDRLNGAWGKRNAMEDPELEEFWDGVEKRPEWGKLKDYLPKIKPLFQIPWLKFAVAEVIRFKGTIIEFAHKKNQFGAWGKRAAVGGWNNLKGLWGKRSWGKLRNSWGKRSQSPMDYEPLNESQ